MIEELLFHLKNWFVKSSQNGRFTIEGGELSLPFLVEGQYYRISGSIFNDGLHYVGDTTLSDETFDGTVYALAIPKAVINLAAEIEAWQEKNGMNPYQSESFGGYSYTKASDPATGLPVTWQSEFRGRLNPWRKI